MSIVKILRVVDCNGEGMYRVYQGEKISLANYIFGASDDVDYDRHPLPSHDPTIYMVLGYYWADTEYKDWRFGFANKYQFLRWIYNPEWRRDMDSLGAKLQVITINRKDCVLGKDQAVFNPAEVLEIKSFPVSSYDNPELQVIIESYLALDFITK